jgi:hypothetical protein
MYLCALPHAVALTKLLKLLGTVCLVINSNFW